MKFWDQTKGGNIVALDLSTQQRCDYALVDLVVAKDFDSWVRANQNLNDWDYDKVESTGTDGARTLLVAKVLLSAAKKVAQAKGLRGLYFIAADKQRGKVFSRVGFEERGEDFFYLDF